MYVICHSVQMTLLSPLVPVKYRINHTAAMGSFVWAVKQVWYYHDNQYYHVSFYLTKIVL